MPGLIKALNSFVGNTEIDMAEALKLHEGFDMNGYRRHILKSLGWGAGPFSAIPILQQDKRLDRIFRFVTLIFMSQAGEVELDQDQGELLVQRIYHEAD